MSDHAVTITDTNISHAWARALLALLAHGAHEIVPLMVSVSITDKPIEDPHVRNLADAALQGAGKRPIRTVANTLFPRSMWNPSAPPETLYARYSAVLPRILHADRANAHGTYFQRMIAYSPEGTKAEVNQLAHVIATYKAGNHRRSALQLSIFDPTRDHTNQRQRGFPCLHQVAFSPIQRGLVVTGLYGTQYIFERGYGNYLGLCELGQFVASEFDLPLVQMTCVAAVAELGVTKGTCADLARDLDQRIRQDPTRTKETEEQAKG